MGRYLMIIAGGLLGLYGIAMLTMQGQRKSEIAKNARSAGEVMASNVAHSATDIAILKLEHNKDWRTGGTPWTVTIDDGTADITVETVGTGSSFYGDTVKVTVDATYGGEQSRLVTQAMANYESIIPEIKSALSIYLKDFGFSGGGDYGINGDDESGKEAALPGITVVNEKGKDTINNNSDPSKITSSADSAITVDPSLDFQSALDLNDQLEASGKAQYISGNYKGELGSESSPGVFVVDQELKITGNTTGYGIMVVKNNGQVDTGSLETAGTFDFHGLIIFEDGWSFDGKGTSAIHGGMIIGGSKYYDYTTIDMNGTFDIKYNSDAIKYAIAAAASAVDKVKFEKLSVYE